MTAPVRLRLSRKRGFELQAHSRGVNGLAAVNVARPGPWGNPFVVGVEGTREDCVKLFEALLTGLIAITTSVSVRELDAYLTLALAERGELRGRNLACWCPPGAKCHADVLLKWANVPACEAAP